MAMELLQPLLPIIGLMFLLAIALLIINRKPQPVSYQYEQREALFTPAETDFLKQLDKDIQGQYRVFGKVRIADVLTPQSGLNRSHWQRAFNQIGIKHFDFVLCDPETLEVKAVVELDDNSHNTPKAKKRDKLVNEACESAGL